MLHGPEPMAQLLRRLRNAAYKDSPATISTNQKFLLSSVPGSENGASGRRTLLLTRARSSVYVTAPLSQMAVHMKTCGALPRIVSVVQVTSHLFENLLEDMATALLNERLHNGSTFINHLTATRRRCRISEVLEVIQLLPSLSVQILQLLSGSEVPACLRHEKITHFVARQCAVLAEAVQHLPRIENLSRKASRRSELQQLRASGMA